jgi:hypothetical protein
MIIISLLLLLCNLLGISLFPAVTLVRLHLFGRVHRAGMDLVVGCGVKADLLSTWFMFGQLQFQLHWVIAYIMTIFAAILAMKLFVT